MLAFSFIPFLFLILVTLFLSLASRLFPEMPIFWMGLPLQCILGIIALGFGFTHFPKIIERALSQLLEMIYMLFKT